MIVSPTKTSTEDTFTASEKNASTKSSSDSNGSYSTSAHESDIESTSSTLTQNTLSMISTPWSTESWNVRMMDGNDTTTDIGSSVLSWPYSDEITSSTPSTLTVLPRSSSSSGLVSHTLHSSGTTVTILNGGRSISTSGAIIKPLTRQNSKPTDTLSSWTVETFTSSGWVTDIDSKVIKAKYPCSLSSGLSGTDIYPSTCDTLTSRKGSRVTIATTGTYGSRKEERGHTAPMSYIGLNNRPGENPLLKWELQIKRINMGERANITAAV